MASRYLDVEDIVAVDVEATERKLRNTWWQNLALMCGWSISVGYLLGCDYVEGGVRYSDFCLFGILFVAIAVVWKKMPNNYKVEYKPYK